MSCLLSFGAVPPAWAKLRRVVVSEALYKYAQYSQSQDEAGRSMCLFWDGDRGQPQTREGTVILFVEENHFEVSEGWNAGNVAFAQDDSYCCLLYTSPSPRD